MNKKMSKVITKLLLFVFESSPALSQDQASSALPRVVSRSADPWRTAGLVTEQRAENKGAWCSLIPVAITSPCLLLLTKSFPPKHWALNSSHMYTHTHAHTLTHTLSNTESQALQMLKSYTKSSRLHFSPLCSVIFPT